MVGSANGESEGEGVTPLFFLSARPASPPSRSLSFPLGYEVVPPPHQHRPPPGRGGRPGLGGATALAGVDACVRCGRIEMGRRGLAFGSLLPRRGRCTRPWRRGELKKRGSARERGGERGETLNPPPRALSFSPFHALSLFRTGAPPSTWAQPTSPPSSPPPPPSSTTAPWAAPRKPWRRSWCG